VTENAQQARAYDRLSSFILLYSTIYIEHYTVNTIAIMIRSTCIPSVLNRICDGKTIVSALLVTADGELLGASTNTNNSPKNAITTALQLKNPESFGTLLADIAMDYHRLGEEYASNPRNNDVTYTALSTIANSSNSHMQCLLLEMDLGLVGIASCGYGCLVMVVCEPAAPMGLVKAQLQTLAAHVQESLSTTTTTTTAATQPPPALLTESSSSVS
jgi:hypothetical protein